MLSIPAQTMSIKRFVWSNHVAQQCDFGHHSTGKYRLRINFGIVMLENGNVLLQGE